MKLKELSHRLDRRRTGTGALLATAAVLALAPAAQAAPPILLTGQCGQVLNQARTYILQNDVGPCSSDGLTIAANNLILDLGGHTISGIPVQEDSSGITGGVGEGNGITAIGRTSVVIKNGTVRDFDAGVLLARSASGVPAKANLLTNLTLSNNVGNQEEASFPPSGPITEFSEGIALVGAPGNIIENNLATANGGAGITINDGSNGNRVRNNRVTNNRGSGIYFPAFVTASTVQDNHISGNGFSGISLAFNIIDNLFHHNVVDGNGQGIGTSAQSDRNEFKNNTVTSNRGSGISFSSRRNLAAGNIVRGNGVGGRGDGITLSGGALPPSTPIFGNVLRANVVQHNTGNGIRITCTRDFGQPGGPCVKANQANRVENNTVSGNGGASAGRKEFNTAGFLIGFFDLLDGNNRDNPGYPASAPECDNNTWVSNKGFTTHYPHCTAG